MTTTVPSARPEYDAHSTSARTPLERPEAEVAAYLIDHPFASATEITEARTAEGEEQERPALLRFRPRCRQFVSVLHASLIISSLKARDEGDEDLADMLAAEDAKIEDAL